MRPPDERLLIKRVLEGHKDDYSDLVRTHQDSIFALIMRQTGNRMLSSELTQETFVKAYMKLEYFRFESRFITWLTRIALNVTHDYFNSRRYKEQLRKISFDVEKHEDKFEQQDSDNREPELNRLREAIGSLPRKLREVAVLIGLEGKKWSEAAEILAIPVGTVSSRMSKAMKLIQETFEK